MEELNTKKDLTVEDLALGERKFLHDISNQLVVAQGISSFLVTALESDENVGEKEKTRIEKVSKSIMAMMDMVKERRAYLYSLTEDEES